MNGSLGRDRLWNQQIWSDIDNAVREEVGRIRGAEKVFPSIIANNVLPVAANRAVPFGAAAPPVVLGFLPPDQFQPFLEISREFVLTQAQADGEESVHLASALARLAAKTISTAEDKVLCFGVNSVTGLPRL